MGVTEEQGWGEVEVGMLKARNESENESRQSARARVGR